MFSAFLSLSDLITFRKKLLELARTSGTNTDSNDKASPVASRVILAPDARSARASSQFARRAKHVLPQDVNQALRPLDRLITGLARFINFFDNRHDKNNTDITDEKEAFLEEMKPYRPVLSPRFLATRDTPSFILKNIYALVEALTRFFETSV